MEGRRRDLCIIPEHVTFVTPAEPLSQQQTKKKEKKTVFFFTKRKNIV